MNFESLLTKASLFFTPLLVINFFGSENDSEINNLNYKETESWIYNSDASTLSSPRTSDLDNNGIQEIIFTTYGKNGSYNEGWIYVLDTTGNPLPGWPKQTSAPIPASASIGDLDNDGYKEIVVGDWNKLHVLNRFGEELPNWPQNVGTSVTCSLYDLDSNGDLEIIYSSSNNRLYIFNHNGSNFIAPIAVPNLLSSPAVGDVNSDGLPEIIAGLFKYPDANPPLTGSRLYVWKTDGSELFTNPSFPANSGSIFASPTLADLNEDGKSEIIFTARNISTNQDYLYAVDSNGQFLQGWENGLVKGNWIRSSSPSVGDIDNDGDLEIFVGGSTTSSGTGNERLYAFHHNGTMLTNDNWPFDLEATGAVNIVSSPIIADVDDNPDTKEILVKTKNNIYALNAHGYIFGNYPYFIDDENHIASSAPSPIITDIDNDNNLEGLFISNFGSVFYYDFSDNYQESYLSWPSYKHDSTGTSSLVPSIDLTSSQLNAYTKSGKEVYVKFNVKNNGYTSAGLFNVSIYLTPGLSDTNSYIRKLDTISFNGLMSMDTINISKQYFLKEIFTSSTTRMYIRIVIDSSNQINEIAETNNRFNILVQHTPASVDTEN